MDKLEVVYHRVATAIQGVSLRVEEIVAFLERERHRKDPVSALPFGTQKLVSVARALAMEPTLLLLDEPSKTVLDFGQRIAAGPPARALRERPVIDAYLGPDFAVRAVTGEKGDST